MDVSLSYPDKIQLSTWDKAIFEHLLRKMFQKEWVDVTTLDECLKKQARERDLSDPLRSDLAALHCEAFSDLAPDIVAALPDKVGAYLNVTIRVQENRPELLAQSKRWAFANPLPSFAIGVLLLMALAFTIIGLVSTLSHHDLGARLPVPRALDSSPYLGTTGLPASVELAVSASNLDRSDTLNNAFYTVAVSADAYVHDMGCPPVSVEQLRSQPKSLDHACNTAVHWKGPYLTPTSVIGAWNAPANPRDAQSQSGYWLGKIALQKHWEEGNYALSVTDDTVDIECSLKDARERLCASPSDFEALPMAIPPQSARNPLTQSGRAAMQAMH